MQFWKLLLEGALLNGYILLVCLELPWERVNKLRSSALEGRVEDNETRMDENGMGEEWLPWPLFLLAVGLLCDSHTAARLPWPLSLHL